MIYNTPGVGNYGATWEAAGYSGAGDVSELIGVAKGRAALVCGGASSVFVDFHDIRSTYKDALVYAANEVGMFLPHVDHWVSLHGNVLHKWKAVRWIYHHPERTFYHAYSNEDIADYHWYLLNPLFALSGYFAMQIAWIMGCSPIILVGCPGSREHRFFEASQWNTFEYGAGTKGKERGVRHSVVAEMLRLPDFKEVVRSMSGWTREYFGGP